ncbi:LysR family transcriptional regulator [Cytobacillus oceanisediminis]|uniref:LysR family transcriptional regulator n=1 Tax=Cytobacillus oceanisediminis TaxID=665099 RepID=UPI001D13AEF0|nr:LysR family transcriptional regulator [Cytobacillus oceanisediminis]MCC3649380.1 LysR family transcriptional regulator [Cytobacillus oceanisediminis]
MNIEKLQYLVEVAKTGSFSIASQNLFVSQSAISQSIVSIEKKLGIKLFERSRGNSAIVTIEGEQIITIANEILLKYHELIDKVQYINNNVTGKLKLSTVPGFTAPLLSPISAIKDKYPKMNIEIFQKPGQDIVDDILEGRSDIGVLPLIKHLLENNDRLIYQNLFEGNMKLLVSKKSPLAEKTFVSPQQIVKETLIVYNGEYIQWFKNNFYKKFGVMNELFSSTNVDTLKKAVDENLGVSFVPDCHGFTYNFSDDVTLLDIVDYDAVKLQFVWIMSSKKHYSRMIKEYITILKENFKSKDSY